MHQSKREHITSSLHYHESTGLAEWRVQTIKCIWDKERGKDLTLLLYCNTSSESGRFLSELLLERNVRTNIPDEESLVPQKEFHEREKDLNRRQKNDKDKRVAGKPEAKFKESGTVWVSLGNKKRKRGVIIRKREEADSYDIWVEGKAHKRNWKPISKLILQHPIGDDASSSEEFETEKENKEEHKLNREEETNPTKQFLRIAGGL